MIDTVHIFANTVLSIQRYSPSNLSLSGLSLAGLSLSIPNGRYAMVVDGDVVLMKDDRGSWLMLVTTYIITYPAEVFSAKTLDDCLTDGVVYPDIRLDDSVLLSRSKTALSIKVGGKYGIKNYGNSLVIAR